MSFPPPEDRRSHAVVWARAIPWLIAGSIAIATIAAFVVVSRSVGSARDSATESAEVLFTNVVRDTESRIALEQSKLLFLLKGASSWAAGGESATSEQLADYMQNQGASDRVPALTWVALTHLSGGDLIVTAASTGAGEVNEGLLGTNLAADSRVADAVSALDGSDVCVMSIYGAVGEENVLLLSKVPGGHSAYLTFGFVGSVFLSPALAHDGVASALAPPGGEFVVVRRGIDVPDSLPDPTGQVELIEGGSTFTYSSEQDVFGTTWTFAVSSGDDFLDIPQSSEHWALLAGGIVLTCAVLGLLIARQRLAEHQAAVTAHLSRSNRRYLTGFDRAPIGAAELAADGTIVRANPTMAMQLGRTVDSLEGRRLIDFVHPADLDDQVHRLEELVGGGAISSQAEVRYLRSDGQIVWITESVASLDRFDDHDRRFLVQSFDTTARRVAELELEHLAFNDPLTGLPNRTRLREHLQLTLDRSLDTGEPVSMLFIDIDRFKVVNDSLGHSAGDEVIATVARRLSEVVDAPHFVARFGGDEFAIVCISNREQADRFADRVLEIIRRPIVLQGENIHITASIGVITSLDATDTPEALLRDVDSAMYGAKAAGRNKTERFEASMRAAAVQRLDLERALRKAIERDEFTIRYQPVIDLETNDIAGFEALLRWEHPERGLLEPSAFLDVASEAGLLDEIDRLTLRRACSQFDDWSHLSDAAKEWHLAVNCSPSWFHDAVLQEILPSVLRGTSFEANRLWLEVTEHDLLSDSEAALESFEELHRMGVNVAIDDFGTGFSSLSYLSQFHVDRLKIDRSFVQSLDRSDADEAIVAAVVELAAALGIRTVAEGTENESQLNAIRRLGADYAQGFLLSRPLSAGEVEKDLIGLD
ncbi:MAG: EAL domain-containing protein [Actinomycetia bacterium]|nr:EAL domain-containing protein [Actinomycetes bacterium]